MIVLQLQQIGSIKLIFFIWPQALFLSNRPHEGIDPTLFTIASDSVPEAEKFSQSHFFVAFVRLAAETLIRC